MILIAIILTLLIYGMSVLLFVSFLSKIVSVTDFKQAVTDFDIVKGKLVDAVAYAVLVLELALSLLFAFQQLLAIAYIANGLMIAGFSFALWQAMRKKKVMNCHCFGTSNKPTSFTFSLIRNGLLLLCSGLGFSGVLITETTGSSSNVVVLVLVSLAITYMIVKEMVGLSSLTSARKG